MTMTMSHVLSAVAAPLAPLANIALPLTLRDALEARFPSDPGFAVYYFLLTILLLLAAAPFFAPTTSVLRPPPATVSPARIVNAAAILTSDYAYAPLFVAVLSAAYYHGFRLRGVHYRIPDHAITVSRLYWLHIALALAFWAYFLQSLFVRITLDEAFCKLDRSGKIRRPPLPSSLSRVFLLRVCNPAYLPSGCVKVADICYAPTDLPSRIDVLASQPILASNVSATPRPNVIDNTVTPDATPYDDDLAILRLATPHLPRARVIPTQNLQPQQQRIIPEIYSSSHSPEPAEIDRTPSRSIAESPPHRAMRLAGAGTGAGSLPLPESLRSALSGFGISDTLRLKTNTDTITTSTTAMPSTPDGAERSIRNSLRGRRSHARNDDDEDDDDANHIGKHDVDDEGDEEDDKDEIVVAAQQLDARVPNTLTVRSCPATQAKRQLVLDVHAPTVRPANPVPVILYVHNMRGWEATGDKTDAPLLTAALAASNFVVVCPNYRMADVTQVSFIDSLIDLNRALRWTTENVARYGGDPSAIITCGQEMGGYLALLLALQRSRVFQPGFEDEDIHRGIVGCAVVDALFDPLNGRKYVKYNMAREFVRRTRVPIDTTTIPSSSTSSDSPTITKPINEDDIIPTTTEGINTNLGEVRRRGAPGLSSPTDVGTTTTTTTTEAGMAPAVPVPEPSVYDAVALRMLSPTALLEDAGRGSRSVRRVALLVVHGARNIRRQPRQFVAQARASGVPTAYAELPGQGAANGRTGVRIHLVADTIARFAAGAAEGLDAPPP